jgi:hypothetical protein
LAPPARLTLPNPLTAIEPVHGGHGHSDTRSITRYVRKKKAYRTFQMLPSRQQSIFTFDLTGTGQVLTRTPCGMQYLIFLDI